MRTGAGLPLLDRSPAGGGPAPGSRVRRPGQEPGSRVGPHSRRSAHVPNGGDRRDGRSEPPGRRVPCAHARADGAARGLCERAGFSCGRPKGKNDLVTRGARAAFPIPTSPVSVTTSTMSQPWKRNEPMESAGNSSRSTGLVQKCGWGATVSPLHSTTRVRISVIFTIPSLFVKPFVQ